MERRISSSFTEFSKVYGIVSLVVFLFIFAVPFYGSPTFPYSLFIFFFGALNLFAAINCFRMKKVEMTDAGLLISSRFFFNEKTIFVPYEKIELLKLKLIASNNTVSIKFTEPTELGKKISFISKGYTINSQAKIVEELNQAIIQNKKAERLNSAFLINF
jgi:hypothetical protein